MRTTGRAIGPYVLTRILGEGGMGTVYEATRRELGSKARVALKLIRSDVRSEHARARFDAERSALQRLSHPNVARLLDAGLDEQGHPYFTMEFVDGASITTFCDELQLDRPARLALFEGICRGIEHAHQRGILHRDLKPSNVLVTRIDGGPVPKIIDFGIARFLDEDVELDRLTAETDLLLGTPQYMSPEQADPDTREVDTRSDIYGLGALLYELLSGSPPFRREDFQNQGIAQVRRILREVDPRPPIGRTKETLTDLDWITLRALHKDPERRYPSVGALLGDLERLSNHLPVEATPPSRIDRARKFARRHRFALSATALILIALATACALIFTSWTRARAAAREAIEARDVERATSDPLRVRFLVHEARKPWPSEATLEANLAWVDGWLGETDSILSRASFAELRSLRTEVASRRAVLETTWPLWERCHESLRETREFASFEFAPHPHLIPLGIELDRSRAFGHVFDPLWIFAVGGTGSLPLRVDEHGEPVPLGEPGFTRMDDDTATLLILVPRGTCFMGAQVEDSQAPGYDVRCEGRQQSNELPVVPVSLEPFLISRYEITQAQYTKFLEATGRSREIMLVDSGPPRQPVGGIDWRDAKVFCDWAGLELPSEAQWEYACRAGTTTSSWNGDGIDDLARVSWFRGNSTRALHAVDSWPADTSPANPWGLYHMLGNVDEWPLDSYYLTHEGVHPDGTARVFHGDNNRGLRGGSVLSISRDTRVALRYLSGNFQEYHQGFRPVMNL
ncbi:MAG: SUMF1/EgtB/PvdO family nonheme iron enzyme [Planctomycetes bacterium]|nr:SUMF1/EgtB/PvdO family nonheme iron enzyme [Planctomycetota bacterium]